ncbi:hypothetical protein ANCDUO_15502 [Ancylostoma duodenale]|uniref:Potassium channel tetramerisation-type BTB domain-containing protein n=1 Tax=Ancylostoma duodenale TaxID=51022 RepID=A0A0C2CDH4_9BILA|nr:hypothetical protein ANCDUO_15502 [Ancylostoma duodenale]
MLADPRSKLAEWFKPGTVKPIATDKVRKRTMLKYYQWNRALFQGGNYYLDRDAKTFRHILAYLRLKKEKFVPSLALPSKPDDLAKLVGECEALNLAELKDLALDLLQKYQRTEEQHYVTSFVQVTLRDFESWQFEREQNQIALKKKPSNDEEYQPNSAYDEWDNL